MPPNMVDVLLDTLRDEAIRLGSDLIKDGAELAKARLKGDATDAQVMAWLREAQAATGEGSE